MTHRTRCAATRRALGAAPGFEWQFFTARSMTELSPLLDGFGQDVRWKQTRSGRPTRAINHMLKLFLIDATGVVREIYSLAFVHPEVMLNDIQTLLMEADRTAARN